MDKMVGIRTGKVKEHAVELEKAYYGLWHSQEITETKNRQLEVQLNKLKEMRKVKSCFFANISRQFRTPLALIMAHIEQMLTGSIQNERERQKKLRLMLRNSQRLHGLVNQLLELSRLGSGIMKLQAARQNIVPLLRGITASFDSASMQNELELIFQAQEENIHVYLDTGKLEEAINNLLSNALAFTPPGGQVLMTVERISKQQDPNHFPAGIVEISISNTGPVIPVHQPGNIYDCCFRFDTTYEHYHEGTCIGLIIAGEVVELHHGSMDVTLRKGETGGCEFILRLPLGKDHLEPGEIVLSSAASVKTRFSRGVPGPPPDEWQEEKQEKMEPGEGEKPVILVVEESGDVRNYIKESLEPLYRVEEAVDGIEGMEKARKIIPELIISDVMIPRLDGYRLCDTLKKEMETCRIPIIFLTARASEEDIIRGLKTGADDYITKPFNTRILLARIENLIRLRRLLLGKQTKEGALEPREISILSSDEAFNKGLLEIIERNLSNPVFSVEQLCKELCMGRTSLYRKCLELTGENPTLFIRSYRLKRAAQLLKANFGNVTEVAMGVGFTSTAYFTKCFKEKFNRLPSDLLTKKSGV